MKRVKISFSIDVEDNFNCKNYMHTTWIRNAIKRVFCQCSPRWITFSNLREAKPIGYAIEKYQQMELDI